MPDWLLPVITPVSTLLAVWLTASQQRKGTREQATEQSRTAEALAKITADAELARLDRQIQADDARSKDASEGARRRTRYEESFTAHQEAIKALTSLIGEARAGTWGSELHTAVQLADQAVQHATIVDSREVTASALSAIDALIYAIEEHAVNVPLPGDEVRTAEGHLHSYVSAAHKHLSVMRGDASP